MPVWGEGSVPDDFESELQYMRDLARLQSEITVRFEERYAANPSLAEFSERAADALAGGTFDGVGHANAYPDHPASEQIHASYKRLVFAFANPENPEDRADDIAMLEFMHNAITGAPDESVELQMLANRFEIISASILACFLALQPRGELEGMTPSQQFQFVQEYYQILLLPGTDDSRGGTFFF